MSKTVPTNSEKHKMAKIEQEAEFHFNQWFKGSEKLSFYFYGDFFKLNNSNYKSYKYQVIAQMDLIVLLCLK